MQNTKEKAKEKKWILKSEDSPLTQPEIDRISSALNLLDGV